MFHADFQTLFRLSFPLFISFDSPYSSDSLKEIDRIYSRFLPQLNNQF